MIHPRNFILLLIAGLLGVTGCQPKNEFVEPPPPTVTVANPERRDVTVYIGLPGRLQAQDSIEIRARVSGYLRSVDFVDGQIVQEGQQLFVIEPEPYIAAENAAAANLAQAEAARDIAQTNYDRREQAYQTKAVSEIDLLTAKANLASADAAVQEATARLRQAQIDLSYTTNRAPATGVIGRRFVSKGNLVGGGEATLLTTLVVQDPIQAYFNIAERQLVPRLQMLAEKKAAAETVTVLLELADGSQYPQEGRLDYVDNEVDPGTGTVIARALFPNDSGELLPGLYGKVLIPEKHENAVLVPDLALLRDIGGNYVLIVNTEGKVESRYVEPGAKVGDQRIVEDGLDGSERVIIEGVQRARPGIVVNPEMAPSMKDSDATEVRAVEEDA